MDNYSFFNVLDYVYIFVILVSCLFGLASGFTKVVLNAATWYGSFVASTAVSPLFYGIMYGCFTDRSMARGAATGLAYIVVLIAMRVLVNFISDGMKKSVLSMVDRALGLLVGFIRGIFIPACVCAIFLLFDVQRNKFDAIKNSRISSIFLNVMESVIPKIETKKISEKIRARSDPIQKTISNATKIRRKIKPKNEGEKHTFNRVR
ncbi:hypothetical protein FACS189472_02070 [Alphaproteobacteria bacterium]|nr:hypothetical protein FACS189472_02070 [Alphaproteobacteria bacterium]